MSTIFVISPNYLESIYHESKKYEFDLQGYGSFALAVKGLIKVNCSDLLGLAFVGLHLPPSRSKEFKSMIEFFDMVELMNANKKFVIASDDTVTPWMKVFKRYKHIRFVKAPDYDFLSDVVINKHVFGSILLDNAEPYVFTVKHVKSPSYETPHLEYVPLFPSTQVQCISKVDVLDTLERTRDNDEVYRRLKSENAYLQYFRLYYIAVLHGDKTAVLDTRNKIDAILDSIQNDTENWCNLLALKNYIEGNVDE